MNAKKAKLLRRQAESLTIGMPVVAYRKYNPCPPGIKKRMVINDKTGIKEAQYFKTGDWNPIVLLHACTRNIYKLLKKSV